MNTTLNNIENFLSVGMKNIFYHRKNFIKYANSEEIEKKKRT